VKQVLLPLNFVFAPPSSKIFILSINTAQERTVRVSPPWIRLILGPGIQVQPLLNSPFNIGSAAQRYPKYSGGAVGLTGQHEVRCRGEK
jgi:hypothetical protein